MVGKHRAWRLSARRGTRSILKAVTVSALVLAMVLGPIASAGAAKPPASEPEGAVRMGTPPVSAASVGGMDVAGAYEMRAPEGTKAASPSDPDKEGTVSAEGDVRAATTEFYDGFEGAFNWLTSGTPTWDDTSWTASHGSWSAWCADAGGAYGGHYDNNMDAWMTIGPYDLSDASSAKLYWDMLAEIETTYDQLFIGISTDGVTYNGISLWGTTNGAWLHDNWIDVGTACPSAIGDSSVWIGFRFTSDATNTYDGAYIDEVLLDKTVGTPAAPCTLSLSRSSAYPAYGAKVKLTGQLKSNGAGVANHLVQLWHSNDAYNWYKCADITSTSYVYAKYMIPRGKRLTYYKMRFEGDADHDVVESNVVAVRPRHYVTKPYAPSSVRRYRYYTFYGYLKPQHSTFWTVRLKLYRYRSGAWRYFGWIVAPNYYSSATTTKYKMRLRFAGATKGKWKVSAWAPQDYDHSAKTSGYDYFTVY